jgi:succinate-acetate transporter protein
MAFRDGRPDQDPASRGRSRVPRRAGAPFSLTGEGLTLERLALQHRHTSNADPTVVLDQAAFYGQLHQIAKVDVLGN